MKVQLDYLWSEQYESSGLPVIQSLECDALTLLNAAETYNTYLHVDSKITILLRFAFISF